MRWRALIATLAIAGAAAGIAVYAWPATAKPLKPLVIRSAAARRLPVIGTLRGVYYPQDFDLSQLIPRGSRINRVWYSPARKHHQQVLVEWTDRDRYIRWGHLRQRIARWGLTLWSSAGPGWRAVRIPVIEFPGPSPADIHIAFADVTGDGRADLLFEQDPGTNHGCGPHRIFTTSASGVTTQAFSSYLCETILHGDHGLLALDMPYYLHNDSMCCATYHEHLRLRWNGRQYVTASLHIS